MRLTEKLSVSFWIWALQDLPPGGCYHDLDARMRELRARGFNCIACDSGAGLAFDLEGRPRGAIDNAITGHGYWNCSARRSVTG